MLHMRNGGSCGLTQAECVICVEGFSGHEEAIKRIFMHLFHVAA